MPHLQTAKHRCFSRVLMKPLFPCAKPTALLRTTRTFVAQSPFDTIRHIYRIYGWYTRSVGHNLVYRMVDRTDKVWKKEPGASHGQHE